MDHLTECKEILASIGVDLSDDDFTESRDPYRVMKRALMVRVLRKKGLSWHRIGELIGNKDHATAIHLYLRYPGKNRKCSKDTVKQFRGYERQLKNAFSTIGCKHEIKYWEKQKEKAEKQIQLLKGRLGKVSLTNGDRKTVGLKITDRYDPAIKPTYHSNVNWADVVKKAGK